MYTNRLCTTVLHKYKYNIIHGFGEIQSNLCFRSMEFSHLQCTPHKEATANIFHTKGFLLTLWLLCHPYSGESKVSDHDPILLAYSDTRGLREIAVNVFVFHNISHIYCVLFKLKDSKRLMRDLILNSSSIFL